MLSDLRRAARLLIKNPAFSGVAVVTLALGIGLIVTVFSIVNVLLFKPLDVPRSSELVWITGASAVPRVVDRSGHGPQERMTC